MPNFLTSTTVIFAFSCLFIISPHPIPAVAQEESPESSQIVTISTGIITAVGAIGGAVAGSYFTVYNANQIEKRKNEEHQQYNVILRSTLTQELRIFRSILDHVKNNSDTFSDDRGKYYVFKGDKEELPRMTREGNLFAIYYEVPLEQRVEAFGSDLTNIIFAHNKIQHIYKLLHGQTSTSDEDRRKFPLYDSLIV